MRGFRGYLLAVPILAACAQSEPADQQRKTEDRVSATDDARSNGAQDGEIRRYSVIVGLTVCPDPADFHQRIDRLLSGVADAPLPPRCTPLRGGTVLLAEAPGNRPFVTYRNWRIERATLSDGKPVWSDDLNEQYLMPAEGRVRG